MMQFVPPCFDLELAVREEMLYGSIYWYDVNAMTANKFKLESYACQELIKLHFHDTIISVAVRRTRCIIIMI